MPHEQWVAFDVSTDNPHKCFKKKTKDKNKKNNKLSAYHGINLEKEIEQNLEDNDLEYENFQTETDEIENLKNLKKDKYLNKKETSNKFKEDQILNWAFSNNIFDNPLVIAIIVVIILSIFLYPNL